MNLNHIKILFTSILCFSVIAKKDVIKIAIPKDVLISYKNFLGKRKPTEVYNYRNKHSRRDVVETVLLLKILNLKDDQYKFVEVDSYERAIKLIESGQVDVYATSVWKNDISKRTASISPTLIRDGEFTAGIYVRPDSKFLQGPFNIRRIKFLSNKAWTRDWKTIKSLGPKSLVSTTTWNSVLKMIHAKRADAILAAFPPNKDLVRYNPITNLVPIPNVKVVINGTRHWAISNNSEKSKLVSKKLQEGVKNLRKKKEFFKAYMQSGFLNERTITWEIINKKGHP